ncbi:MAG TPA: STAS domain-containing protein [Candidatus Limnocylindria bacterium]
MPSRLIVCDLGAVTAPDLGTVDGLARLCLRLRRRGCRLRLCNVPPELRELLELAGLGALLLEPERQAEEREEPLRVQEEGDPGDSVA